MDIHYYMGIDVSKATLDWAVFDGKTVVLQTQSPNSELGIKATLKLIKALPAFTAQTSITCSEHTGIYNALILAQLSAAGFPLWLESSLQIKQAGGLQRGKSDQMMLFVSLNTRFASVIGYDSGNHRVNCFKTWPA